MEGTQTGCINYVVNLNAICFTQRKKKKRENNRTIFHYLNILYLNINNADIYLNIHMYLLFKYLFNHTKPLLISKHKLPRSETGVQNQNANLKKFGRIFLFFFFGEEYHDLKVSHSSSAAAENFDTSRRWPLRQLGGLYRAEEKRSPRPPPGRRRSGRGAPAPLSARTRRLARPRGTERPPPMPALAPRPRGGGEEGEGGRGRVARARPRPLRHPPAAGMWRAPARP